MTEQNFTEYEEISNKPIDLWEYVGDVYGKPISELWDILEDRVHGCADIWRAIVPEWKREAFTTGMFASVALTAFLSSQNHVSVQGVDVLPVVISTPVVAEDQNNPDNLALLCNDENNPLVCVYLSIISKPGLQGTPTPTSTPTATPTPTNTYEPTWTATPTKTPVPPPEGYVRYVGNANDLTKECIDIACRWYVKFVPANTSTCLEPNVDFSRSQFRGQAMDTFPANQQPVLTLEHMEDFFSQWEIDFEFIMFQNPNPSDPKDYWIEVVCKKP